MKGKTALLLIAGLFSVMFLVSAEWERPSNIAYGEMFIENNTVTTVIETKGAWANITTGATVGTFKRVAYFNGTLTAEIQGLYDVSYSISFSDGNNIEFESAILLLDLRLFSDWIFENPPNGYYVPISFVAWSTVSLRDLINILSRSTSPGQ